MYKFIIIISFFALFLLALLTAIIVKLNWSEKLYSPLLSLALIGTVSTFITVLVSLKGESFETSFLTCIVIDGKTHMPPELKFDQKNRLNERLRLYHLLYTPINFKTVGIDSSTLPSSTEEEAFYSGELLQFDFLKEILNKQSDLKFISTGEAGLIVDTYPGYKLKENELQPIHKLLSKLKGNRFLKAIAAESIIFGDSSQKVKLPKGLKVEFNQEPASEWKGLKKYIIELKKDLYFSMEITIEPLFITEGSHESLPANLKIDSTTKNRCYTRGFTVRIMTKFNRLTAGNWRTDELKSWTKSLVAELQKVFSDNRSLKLD